jgi:hypothetical protein
MDAQQSVSQAVAEDSLPSKRNVSPPKRHPWWAWVVLLLAGVGILFVLASLFSAAVRQRRADVGAQARVSGGATNFLRCARNDDKLPHNDTSIARIWCSSLSA